MSHGHLTLRWSFIPLTHHNCRRTSPDITSAFKLEMTSSLKSMFCFKLVRSDPLKFVPLGCLVLLWHTLCWVRTWSSQSLVIMIKMNMVETIWETSSLLPTRPWKWKKRCWSCTRGWSKFIALLVKFDRNLLLMMRAGVRRRLKRSCTTLKMLRNWLCTGWTCTQPKTLKVLTSCWEFAPLGYLSTETGTWLVNCRVKTSTYSYFLKCLF